MRVKFNLESKTDKLPGVLASLQWKLSSSRFARNGDTWIVEGEWHSPQDTTTNVIGVTYVVAVGGGEDCIAVEIDGKGILVGPNAKAWGEFKPELFKRIPAKAYKPTHGGYPG